MVELKRDLGVWGAAAIVVGTVIGSGIFLVPKKMVLVWARRRWCFSSLSSADCCRWPGR